MLLARTLLLAAALSVFGCSSEHVSDCDGSPQQTIVQISPDDACAFLSSTAKTCQELCTNGAANCSLPDSYVNAFSEQAAGCPAATANIALTCTLGGCF